MSKPQSSSALRGEPFVEVTRGGVVESIHHVAACAVDSRGEPVLSMGEVLAAPVFLRSSAKPFIAATVLAAGARERFGLEPREIAVMAGSHGGQSFHVEAVRSILRKIDMPESALQCGVHPPYNAAAAQELQRAGIAPTEVYNNCSGKHAGILALCKIIGADPKTYLEASNPAEQRILDFCARVSGTTAEAMPIGVDGCGIPVYAVPLRNAALSFLRLAAPDGVSDDEAVALQTVRDAMIAFPEYVSGTGEFDARLMQTAGGSIASKAGAEGVHGVAALPQSVGLVCKILDGTVRARGPAVLAMLRSLQLLSEAQLTKLADLERPIVYNRAGRAVGEISARKG
ncbi:MAG TPA: asparaginase [Candidatus Rubrimentiphilum sp.]|nr:asparaginase [Candidatus Rubrimentiphilum sp.]